MATHATEDQKSRRPLISGVNSWRTLQYAQMTGRNQSQACDVLLALGWAAVSERRYQEVSPKAPGIDRSAPHTTVSYHVPTTVAEAIKELSVITRRSASATMAMLINEALAARQAATEKASA
jgi:hypothetical protein